MADRAGPVTPLIEPTPQQATERLFRAIDMEKVLTIGSETPGHILYMIAKPLHVTPDDALYLVDEGIFLGKKFSPEGKLLTTYGNGEGNGPGEFRRPFHISVRPDGKVLINDTGRRKVSLFENDGTFIKDINVGKWRSDFVLPLDDAFIINPLTDSPDLLTMLDYKGNELSAFGRLIEDQHLKGMSVRGTVAWSDLEQTVIQVGRYTGHIAAFTLEGELRYYVEAMGALGLPDIVFDSRYGITVDHNYERNGDPYFGDWILQAHGERLYVSVEYIDPGVLYVDVYDVRDGSYLYSFLRDYTNVIQLDCIPLFITDAYLYENCVTYVNKWAYQLGEVISTTP